MSLLWNSKSAIAYAKYPKWRLSNGHFRSFAQGNVMPSLYNKNQTAKVQNNLLSFSMSCQILHCFCYDCGCPILGKAMFTVGPMRNSLDPTPALIFMWKQNIFKFKQSLCIIIFNSAVFFFSYLIKLLFFFLVWLFMFHYCVWSGCSRWCGWDIGNFSSYSLHRIQSNACRFGCGYVFGSNVRYPF